MVDLYQLTILQDDSRYLNGKLNGDLGVVKSMIPGHTEDSNVACGFSLTSVDHAIGYIISPLGILSAATTLSLMFWEQGYSSPFYRRCLITAARPLARLPFVGQISRLQIELR